MDTVTLPSMQYKPGQMTAAAPGGCWTCRHFLGELVARGAHVRCRQRADQPRVIATPSAGCAYWGREPGAD
jgi:hypothetical protein